MPEEQAKIQAMALKDVVDDRLVTRDYQDARLHELELRLENRLEANKHEILKWMINAMVAQTALIVAIIAFLK